MKSFSLLPLDVVGSEAPLAENFPVVYSRRPENASSRKITSVQLSIMALLKLFCFVTLAIRLSGMIWNTGAKRLVFPLSADPIAHGTGCLCFFGRNNSKKSAQNCCTLSSERLFLRISSKYLGSGSFSLSKSTNALGVTTPFCLKNSIKKDLTFNCESREEGVAFSNFFSQVFTVYFIVLGLFGDLEVILTLKNRKSIKLI